MGYKQLEITRSEKYACVSDEIMFFTQTKWMMKWQCKNKINRKNKKETSEKLLSLTCGVHRSNPVNIFFLYVTKIVGICRVYFYLHDPLRRSH